MYMYILPGNVTTDCYTLCILPSFNLHKYCKAEHLHTFINLSIGILCVFECVYYHLISETTRFCYQNKLSMDGMECEWSELE